MARFHKFWRFWFNKTPQERQFIMAMLAYTGDLLKKVDRKHVVSIYLHGSFPRRDLRPGSDIDYKLITDDDADLEALSNLRDDLADDFEERRGVRINLSFYTITELRTGDFLNGEKHGRRLPPWKFVDHIDSSKLFYGQVLYAKDFHQKPAEERLRIAWKVAGRYIGKHWKPDKEVDRLVLISKFVMDLVHQMDNYAKGKKTQYIKHELVKRFAHDEKHIIHLMWQVIHNPQDYDTEEKRAAVYDKIIDFLEESKDFCGCHGKEVPKA